MITLLTKVSKSSWNQDKIACVQSFVEEELLFENIDELTNLEEGLENVENYDGSQEDFDEDESGCINFCVFHKIWQFTIQVG